VLPATDVRITVHPTGRASGADHEYLVTVTHWPTKIQIQAVFLDARQEIKAVNLALHGLEKKVALHKHRESKSKQWP